MKTFLVIVLIHFIDDVRRRSRGGSLSTKLRLFWISHFFFCPLLSQLLTHPGRHSEGSHKQINLLCSRLDKSFTRLSGPAHYLKLLCLKLILPLCLYNYPQCKFEQEYLLVNLPVSNVYFTQHLAKFAQTTIISFLSIISNHIDHHTLNI